MSILLTIIWAFLAIIVSVFVLLLSFQIIGTLAIRLSPKYFNNADSLPKGFTYSVIIPAHNESKLIRRSIESIVRSDPDCRIIVVADNCTDDTAEISKYAGAEVLIRTNLSDRGKSYALDYGVKYLESDRPDVVVFVDADCVVEKGSLLDAAFYSFKRERPVQCLYLMRSSEGSSFKTKIAEFAWLVKNQVRPLGFSKFNLPCQLMGSGMAFPWQLLSKVEVANGSIVEDLKLGLDCAALNNAPLFFSETLITSDFPLNENVETAQRKRWEHGHIEIILKELPIYLWNSLRSKNFQLFALVLDAALPPLSLLVLLKFSGLMLGVLCFFFGDSQPLILSSFLLLVFVVGILSSWLAYGRSILKISDLMKIPLYIVKKIPVYIGFVFSRQKSWNATKRD